MTISTHHNPLGKTTHYPTSYDPSLLFPMPRINKRNEIGLPTPLPFKGHDLWNAYELSWLNAKGKPVIAMAQFIVPCTSPNIVESKSLKLYLNSFNLAKFANKDEVLQIIKKDLSSAVGAPVDILFTHPLENSEFTTLPGVCIDDLDIEVNEYQPNPNLLQTEDKKVTEILHSHLLKSNCLVTNQPDWGSIVIHYQGQKINHEQLLKYLISFRNHNEFAEQFVERVFLDIWTRAKPEKLSVYACYTRRGGLDINPFRSTFENAPLYCRTHRQ